MAAAKEAKQRKGLAKDLDELEDIIEQTDREMGKLRQLTQERTRIREQIRAATERLHQIRRRTRMIREERKKEQKRYDKLQKKYQEQKELYEREMKIKKGPHTTRKEETQKKASSNDPDGAQSKPTATIRAIRQARIRLTRLAVPKVQTK